MAKKPPVKRNENGTYPKGQSGNPGGRPKHKRLSTALEQELDRLDMIKPLMRVILTQAMNGERWASELIFDRLEGKPSQRIDIFTQLVEQAKEAGVDPADAVEMAEEIIRNNGS